MSRGALHRESSTGTRGIPVLSGVLAVVVLGLAFFGLMDALRKPDAALLDERLLLALRQPDNLAMPRGPAWLRTAALDVTALGGGPVLLLVVLAVVGFLGLVGRWRTLGFVLASTLGGVGFTLLLKQWVARPRPSVVPHLTPVLGESFPSGHAMLSAIVYLTLGALMAQLTERKVLRAYMLAVALVATVLIGLTRVYLGVHYPTDVLGGWIAGLGWALFTAVLARTVRLRSPRLREESRRGAWSRQQ